MQPFTTLSGVAAPLDLANVDTDQIIPKQFLKRIERTGIIQAKTGNGSESHSFLWDECRAA